jgi:hypothetical protein
MASRKAFLMRIDPALWDELEAWAQEELRSVNGQVEYVLKQAVQKRKGVGRTKLASQTPIPQVVAPPSASDLEVASATAQDKSVAHTKPSSSTANPEKPEPQAS